MSFFAGYYDAPRGIETNLISARFYDCIETFAKTGKISGICFPQGDTCGGDIHFRGDFTAFKKLVAESFSPSDVLNDARVRFIPYG